MIQFDTLDCPFSSHKTSLWNPPNHIFCQSREMQLFKLCELCYRIVQQSIRSYLFSKCLSLKFKVCSTLKFSQRQHYDKNDAHICFVFSYKIYFNTFWHGGIFLFSFGWDYFPTEFLTQLFNFSIGEKWQKLGYFDNCSARWV